MKGKNFWVLVSAVGFVLMAGSVFAACNSQSTDNSQSMDNSQSVEQEFYCNGILLGTTLQADYDGDWLSDRFEFQEYGTAPLKIDTDEDGIDDFNEIFTYPHLLDPLDPTDAKEFLAMIPDMEAKSWKWYETGATGSAVPFTKIVSVAKRDPLVQWYAKHTIIEWQDAAHNIGRLKVNGAPLRLGSPVGEEKVRHLIHPSYYLTHGRRGQCLETATSHYTILELMGYDCLYISGRVSDLGHAWLEANIEGKVYVVESNHVERVEPFLCPPKPGYKV